LHNTARDLTRVRCYVKLAPVSNDQLQL
jgi:hypothetical protein